MSFLRISILISVSFLIGCSSQAFKPNVEMSVEAIPTLVVEKTTPDLVNAIISADAQIEGTQSNVAPRLFNEKLTEVDQHPQVLIELNDSVKKWIKYFTTAERKTFQIFLERGEAYRNKIEGILTEVGVPKEFFYLAMIESGFSTHAVSSAKAKGIWQFMSGTGTRYGLQCDKYVDERKDPVRSTRAAAEYLKDLHNVFGSWRLAMAAYNAGEYRILRAIMQGKSRDFWTLAEKKILPKETMNYVPKFLAAVIIGSNLKKYGFNDLKPSASFVAAELVKVPSPIALRTVSEKAKVPLNSLRALNPHVLKSVTPSTTKFYPLWIPKEHVSSVQKAIPVLASLRMKASRKIASTRPTYYRVKRGDFLVSIAKRYGVSVKHIKKLNRLRSNTILAGTKLILHRNGNTYNN